MIVGQGRGAPRARVAMAAVVAIGVGAWMAVIGCDQSPRGEAPGSAPQPATNPAVSQRAPAAQAVEAALRAAEQYQRSQEDDKAEAILAQLVKEAPREVRAWEAYGQLLYVRAARVQDRDAPAAAELFRRAHDRYEAAVEIEPASAGLRHSAALMAIAAERRDVAIAHLAEAGRLEPENPQYPLHLAQLLLAERRLDEAESQLRRVLEIDAEEPFALATLAAVAMERGDMTEALARVEAARSIDPASVALRVQESKIRRRNNEARRALELLVPLSESQRTEEAVAYEVAAAYGMLGDHARAAAAWEHRLKSNPRDWRSAVHAAESWIAAGEIMKARLDYEAAASIAPDAPQVRQLAGRLAGSGM